ncbi:VanZ family protein [Rhabdothermincola salaria]|uniref:VanZ family protein n=1 Tax=Rhabdothermincola salaria TaxID=2903142 RepID=UPI001E41B981|nr:VanZ family protein [Rhabdothermincola salaria]MCD9622775.1 VanZ family protein [Rhabdothermincola salaria]
MAVALGGLGALAVTAVLMLADRAPGALRRLSDRIDVSATEAGRLTELVPVSRSDTEVHIAVWCVVTLLFAFVVWSWWGAALVGVAAFGLSVAVEIAQRVLTDTRDFQRSDVVANAVGVVLGLGLFACGRVVWWAWCRLRAH